jgi:hypothetical protein
MLRFNSHATVDLSRQELPLELQIDSEGGFSPQFNNNSKRRTLACNKPAVFWSCSASDGEQIHFDSYFALFRNFSDARAEEIGKMALARDVTGVDGALLPLQLRPTQRISIR